MNKSLLGASLVALALAATGTALAQQPGTVVLDARSERMFNRLHIDGAVNLRFPDFTDSGGAVS